jgi:hypothetical protein
MKEVITVMVTRDVQNVICFCNGMESNVLVAAVFLGQSHIIPCQRENCDSNRKFTDKIKE